MLAAPQYPKPEPALAADAGWLVLACLALLSLWALSRAESFRRGVLGREDPRVFAVLRVGFAVMTIQCFWNLEPYWRMLWSDEGVFMLEEARERLGRTQLRGWTEVDGFLDWWGVARFLWGDQSLFYLHGEPSFVRAYLWVFMGLLCLYALGFRTRVTGFLCWFLMLGIYDRNALYIEGTDTVYKVFWLLLVFAPTGDAWSIDNALRVWRERRRRRLRRTGLDVLRLLDRLISLAWMALWGIVLLRLLDMPTAPLWLALAVIALVLVAQSGVEALADDGEPQEVVVYRLVPMWTRVLMMAQLAAIYTTTGLVKTGSIWARGDALYYSLNMDHFYRVEGLTQQVSALVSLNLFRVATWVTHGWEIGFPVVLLGMVLRFGLLHRDEPWYRAQQAVRWRVWLGRLALLGAYLVLYRLTVVAFPWCLAKVQGQLADPTLGLRTIHVVFAGICPALVIAWAWVGRRPIRVIGSGLRMGRVRLPAVTLDQSSLRAWVLGRRVWLGLGFAFHGFLIVFMNIGMFPFIMLTSYVAYTESRPWVWLLRRGLVAARARSWSRRLVPSFADQLVGPAQSPAAARNDTLWLLDPYRVFVGGWTLLGVLGRRRDRSALVDVARRARERGGRVPDAAVFVLALSGIGLVALRASGYRWDDELGTEWLKPALWLWMAAVLVVGAGAALWRRGPRDEPALVGAGPAVASGSLPRTASLLFCGWHVGAVATILFPAYPVFDHWRGVARRPFTEYVSATGITQSWRMFAPNPPRSNTFMQTIVVERDGDRWDLRNNAFDERPNPWIFNDRMRKMQRRMVAKGRWYLRYWAAFQCREWTLRTGEMPLEIQVEQLTTVIPTPERVWFEGPYRPSELAVESKHVQTHACERIGELPVYMKDRYGIPATEADFEDAAKAADRAEKRAEARRRAWERRRDFGGSEP